MRLFFTIMLTQCVCAFRVGLELQHGPEGIPVHMVAAFHDSDGRSQKRPQTLVEESRVSFATTPPAYTNTPYEDYLAGLASELGKRLCGLVDTLKGYFVGDEFLVVQFEDEARFINSELVFITSEVRKLRRRQAEDMYDQLDYVNHMFRDMIRSIETLKHYPASGSPDSHLLHCITELNILLYSVFDAFGIPDSKRAGFSYKVSRFVQQFQFCRMEFAKLTDIPIGVTWMFESMCDRVRGTLEHLETQIPHNERVSNIKGLPW